MSDDHHNYSGFHDDNPDQICEICGEEHGSEELDGMLLCDECFVNELEKGRVCHEQKI